MKIGITGSTGVLGRILTQKLLNKSTYEVIPFKSDISDVEVVRTWVNAHQFDAIFHFAALVAVDLVKNNPLKAYSTNVGGTINLLKGLDEASTKPWLFYASSSHVYKSKNTPIDENDLISPLNTYGQTKYWAEKIVSEVAPSLSIDYCIGRIFSFFHSTQVKPFLYPSLMARLATEDLAKPFFLAGAHNVRDLSNAEDIVDHIILLFEKRVSNAIVNIGSGEGITIKDFLISQLPTHISNIEIVTDESEPNYLVADISHFKCLTNG